MHKKYTGIYVSEYTLTTDIKILITRFDNLAIHVHELSHSDQITEEPLLPAEIKRNEILRMDIYMKHTQT